MKIIKILVITFFVIVFIGALAVMLETPEVPEEITEETAEELATTFKETYLQECAEGGGMEYCLCTWEIMVDKLGERGLMIEAIDFTNGTMTPELQEAVVEAMTSCIHLFE